MHALLVVSKRLSSSYFATQVAGLLLGLLILPSLVCAETRFDAAQFSLKGTRTGHFFDSDSTGTVLFSIPPAQSSHSEPVVLRRFALCADDEWTTSTQYDPASAFSVEIPVADCSFGPHYVICRLPESRRVRWTYFCMLPEEPSSLSRDPVSPESLAQRWHKLVLRKMGAFYDPDTTGTWLANDPDTDYHWMREDVYYAVALLDDITTESHVRANAILRTIARAQDRQTTSSTYGWFYVNGADMRTPQNASTFFIPPVLAYLCVAPPPSLEPETLAEIRSALWYVTDGVASRFLFPPIYENFYYMGTATLALAGEIFDNGTWKAAARSKLEAAHQYYRDRGGSAEWASPVYAAVSDWALGLIEEYSTDITSARLARYLRHRLWLDVGASFNPSNFQPAGPFSRVYEDGLRGGSGLTAFALAIMLGREGFDHPSRLAEMVAAKHSLDMNPSYWIAKRAVSLESPILQSFLLSRSLPWEVRQRTYYTEAQTYVTPAFSLGSVAATTAPLTGFEGLVAQIYESTSPTGLSPIFARLGVIESDSFVYSSGDAHDMFGFQDRGRVIWLADRTFASSTPATKQVALALICDERFSRWQDWRVDGAVVTPPTELPLGSIVTARRAGTFLAAIPLYANSLGTRSRAAAIVPSCDHVALALYGLDSPTSEPLAGKRFEAGWAFLLSEANLWPSYDAFVLDCVNQSRAETVWSPTGLSIAWEWHSTMGAVFSRTTRDWLSRTVDGHEVSFPLLDSPIGRQTEETTLALYDLRVENVALYSWLVYPPNSEAATIGNSAPEIVSAMTNWLSEPVTLDPYGLFTVPRPHARIESWPLYTTPTAETLK